MHLWGGARQFAALALPLLLPTRCAAAGGSIAGGCGVRSPGQASTVETRFLRMTLDHDGGSMEGTVLEGRFRGRRLEGHGRGGSFGIWRTCRREDEQSAAVLEAWLDRVHGGVRIFSFYYPDFSPEGVVLNKELYAPEAQLFTGTNLIGLSNGLGSSKYVRRRRRQRHCLELVQHFPDADASKARA